MLLVRIIDSTIQHNVISLEVGKQILFKEMVSLTSQHIDKALGSFTYEIIDLSNDDEKIIYKGKYDFNQGINLYESIENKVLNSTQINSEEEKQVFISKFSSELDLNESESEVIEKIENKPKKGLFSRENRQKKVKEIEQTVHSTQYNPEIAVTVESKPSILIERENGYSNRFPESTVQSNSNFAGLNNEEKQWLSQKLKELNQLKLELDLKYEEELQVWEEENKELVKKKLENWKEQNPLKTEDLLVMFKDELITDSERKRQERRKELEEKFNREMNEFDDYLDKQRQQLISKKEMEISEEYEKKIEQFVDSLKKENYQQKLVKIQTFEMMKEEKIKAFKDEMGKGLAQIRIEKLIEQEEKGTGSELDVPTSDTPAVVDERTSLQIERMKLEQEKLLLEVQRLKNEQQSYEILSKRGKKVQKNKNGQKTQKGGSFLLAGTVFLGAGIGSVAYFVGTGDLSLDFIHPINEFIQKYIG